MAFQNHEGQVRSFQMPACFWYRRAERSREEGQPVRALSLLRHAAGIRLAAHPAFLL